MDDCIIWWKGFFANGYGVIKRRGKTMKAHRMIYEECFGMIPEGMVVRHTCDNPPCVNPAHLLLGTPKDNMRDKMERGRAGMVGRKPKTHCKHGHEYTPENTRYADKPHKNWKGEKVTYRARQCKTCLRQAQKRWRDRQEVATT